MNNGLVCSHIRNNLINERLLMNERRNLLTSLLLEFIYLFYFILLDSLTIRVHSIIFKNDYKINKPQFPLSLFLPLSHIFKMNLKIKNLTNKKEFYSKFGATITTISNFKNEGW